MPRIEIKSISEGLYSYYENTLNYVAKKDRCRQGYLGAVNIYLPQKRKDLIPTIREEIRRLREFYGQEDRRLGIHFIVNFSSEELVYLSPIQVLEIGYHIAQTEFTDCMTYFAVHDHTSLLHLDMLIIPINIHTGKMYSCGRAGWSGIETRLQKYLVNYMPESMVGEFQTAFTKAK